jgi:polyisoprenyl-phosphate glycosyltransferase
MTSKKKMISIIIPCYNEEDNIFYSFDALNNYIEADDFFLDYQFEMIYIDDGSKDSTVILLQELQKRFSQVRIIELSRNFGKEIAVSAGFANARGDAAIIMDADLQYPIDKLQEFITLWSSGYEVVIGIRDKKKTSNIIEILGSKTYYWLMNHISETDVISGALDYRMIDRKVIEQFNRFTERGRIARVLIDWLGFKRVYISYKEEYRQFGQASYSFTKRLKLAIDSILNHSKVPMNIIGLVGGLGLFISLPASIILTVSKITNDPFRLNVTTTVSLSIFNSLMTSLILMSMWLLSKYIGNIHEEVINRPLYVIKE